MRVTLVRPCEEAEPELTTLASLRKVLEVLGGSISELGNKGGGGTGIMGSVLDVLVERQ